MKNPEYGDIDLYLSSPGKIDIIPDDCPRSFFWRIVLFHEFLSVNYLLSAAYFLNKILAGMRHNFLYCIQLFQIHILYRL